LVDMIAIDPENLDGEGKLIPWDTPFSDAERPSVSIMVNWDEICGETVDAIVSPRGLDQDPKYIVHFGKVQAVCSMEEAHTPRDFSRVAWSDDDLCAFEYIGSPWLRSYDGGEYFFNGPYDIKTQEPVKFRHFVIFGGDSNIEVITPNTPFIRMVSKRCRIESSFEL